MDLNQLNGKTKEEKLKYLNDIKYPVTVNQRKDKFHLMIPELSLMVTSKNIDDGYKRLIEEKQSFFEDLIDSEVEDCLRLPKEGKEIRDISFEIKLFIYKLMVLLLIISIPMGLGGYIVKKNVNSVIRKISNNGVDAINQLVYKIEKKITDVPESKKQARLERIKIIVDSLSPYSTEFHRLLIPPKEKNSCRTDAKQ